MQSGKKREDGRVQMCVNVNHVCVKYQSYVMTLLYAAEELNNSYLLDMQSRILKSALSSIICNQVGKGAKVAMGRQGKAKTASETFCPQNIKTAR